MEDLSEIRRDQKRCGFGLIQYDDGPVHSYPYDAPWLDDPDFGRLYNAIRQNTLVDRNRCYALYLLADQMRTVPGDVLEVGAWRGGTAGIFTSVLPDKMVYVADTFEGVVKSSEWEHYKDRAHNDTSVETVTQLLRGRLGVSNFTILHGIFPDQTSAIVADKIFSLVYLDVDVYRSTKEAFEWVWPRVSTHGVVVFDDYGFISACSGIKRFVDEVRGDSDKLFFQNLNGQAYLIKIA